MSEKGTNIHPIFDRLVGRDEREKFLKQKSHCFWLTGLSGSGKSTIAQGVERVLMDKGFFAQVLDGDNIRSGVCNNLSFSAEDRVENIRRISEVTKLYLNSGIITLNSFISPTIEIRANAAKIIGEEYFKEVYINTSLEECERRDVKGLYKKARAGEIKNFTGIDAPYEAPENPHFEVKTEAQSIEDSVEMLSTYIIEQVSLNM